jgi:hypothetical protein
VPAKPCNCSPLAELVTFRAYELMGLPPESALLRGRLSGDLLSDGLRGYLTEDAGLTGADTDALLLMLGEGSILAVTMPTGADGPVRIVRRADVYVVMAAEG